MRSGCDGELASDDRSLDVLKQTGACYTVPNDGAGGPLRLDIYQAWQAVPIHDFKNGAERSVLDWISDALFKVFGWIPNWLYADDSPRYLIVRSLLGLLLLVAVILIVAVWRMRRNRQQGDRMQGPG